MPQRIQLRRTKGWRKPEGAIVVARPTKWGNPFKVDGRRILYRGVELWGGFPTSEAAVAHAVKSFRWQIINHPNVTGFTVDDVRRELRGHDLACWCPPSAPCHADVLLELANQEECT
jgi:hypothetical protein